MTKEEIAKGILDLRIAISEYHEKLNQSESPEFPLELQTRHALNQAWGILYDEYQRLEIL